MPGQPRARNGASLPDLLDALYAAALDPQGWDVCLRMLADAVGGVGPGLSFWRGRRHAELLSLDVARSRTEEWHERGFDTSLRESVVRNDIQGTFLASEFPAIPVWSELLEDWARPQGFSDLLQGHFVSAEMSCGIGVFREPSARPFGADQIALVDRLMPHITRAMQLRDRLARVADERDSASAVLERLGIGFLLLDERARALEVSAGAQAIFAARDGFELRNREIQVSDPRARALLARLLADVAADPAHPGGSLSVARPSGRRPYEVLAMRLPSARFRWAGSLATAVAFVTDPENEPRASEEVLHQLYGLTHAEARVAAQLAAGSSLAEIAEDQSVLVRSVRNQLASIFAKTQTRRQGELVALLLSGLGRLASR